MDSFSNTNKLNSLQRDLLELNLKEDRLKKELEEVANRKKAINMELNKLMENDRVAKDVLSRVYEQRRGGDTKPKRK